MIMVSGGLQEETTILKVPCITLRENTERPVTVEIGSNQIVGTDTDKIVEAYRSVRDETWDQATIPPLWDGKAAERIVEILMHQFEKKKPTVPQKVLIK